VKLLYAFDLHRGPMIPSARSYMFSFTSQQCTQKEAVLTPEHILKEHLV